MTDDGSMEAGVAGLGGGEETLMGGSLLREPSVLNLS